MLTIKGTQKGEIQFDEIRLHHNLLEVLKIVSGPDVVLYCDVIFSDV